MSLMKSLFFDSMLLILNSFANELRLVHIIFTEPLSPNKMQLYSSDLDDDKRMDMNQSLMY